MSQINNELLENAKKNSIGADKKELLKTNKKNVSKKILVSLFAFLLSISMCACSGIKYYSDAEIYAVDLYRISVCDELNKELRENDMEVYGGSNSIEQYLEIKEYLVEDNMYFYYTQMGREECDKICQVFGYDNFDDFLVKNNCVNEKGEPSIEVLKDKTYSRIIDAENLEEKQEKTK